MTEASAGLRKALARKAGVSKLTPEELLAEMSEEQKTALAASLAPQPVQAAADPAAEPEAEAEEAEEAADKKKAKKKDGDEYMGDDKAKAATDRALAVMSSEHFAGREASAKTLLANEKLSADEIVKILADLSPAAPADPEADARADMKAALKENAPSGVQANDGKTKTNPAAKAESVWDSAIATVFGTNKAA